MATVGRATVLVSPSFKGFQQDASKEGTAAGNRSGRTFGQTFSKWAGRAVKVGAGAALGVLGYSLAKGFQRLTSIEDATAKLRGLGHSAGTVQKAMDSALAAVKGTAYGLDEAATVAASVMAAGVKPGKELERTLKLVADAATIGGSSMSEMGDIFNKVATSNKVQGDVINQLNAQGIPIIQMLAKSMGKTSEEVLELSRKGEIGFAEFQKAMEQGLGGAALESGNTTMGALKNVQAALGRFGAALLSGIFPSMKKGFGGMITLIDKATTAITPFAEAIGQKLGVAMERMVGWISSLDYSSVGAFFKSMGAGASKTGSVLGELGKSFLNLASVLPDVAKGAIDILAAALGFLAKHMDKIVKYLPYIIAGWAAYRAASLAVTAATQKLQAAQLAMTPVMTLNNILRLAAIKGERRHAIASGQYTAAASAQAGLLGSLAALRARDVAGMVAQRVAAFATAAATKAMAVAQRILNLAMRANPIGLIITGLMLLVGGIVLAYKKSETFRNIVQGAWTGIKNAATVVVTWFQTVAWPVLQKIFTAVGNAAKWLWTNAIAPAVNGIMAVWRKMASVFKAVWTGFLSPVFQLIGAIVKWLAIKIFKAHVAVIQRVWNTFAAVFRKAYTGVIQPIISYFSKSIQGWKLLISAAIRFVQRAWNALGAAWRALYSKHIAPIVNAFKAGLNTLRTVVNARIASIKSLWSGMGAGVRATYNKHLRPIVDAFKDKIDTLKSKFKSVVDAIKGQWNRIEAIAKAPVKFVIKTVLNDGLIKGFNVLAKAFGTDEIDKITLPKGFRDGGPIPGRFNSARRDNMLIRAEPDEWIINRGASKRMEDAFPGYLKYINTHGEPPGYRKGGQVQPVPGRGNRHTSGYSWATWAGDFPQPSGTPIRAWKDGVIAAIRSLTSSYGKHVRMNHTDGSSSLYAHMSRFASIVVGQAIKAGQTIGYVGSTGNSTGPHLHFETMKGAFSGGSGDGGGFDLLGSIKNLVAGPMKKLKEKFSEFGNSGFATMVKGAGLRLGAMVKEKAAGLFKNITDKISGAAGSAGIAARWGGLITKHLAKNRMPLGLLDNLIRQIQSESGGNPAAVQQVRDVNWPHNKAVGLLQIIPGTFARYRDPSLPNDRKNGEASIAAAIRYIKARYGSRAESVIGHGHGYDSGGFLQPGYTLAFNGTRKPEPVFTNGQWDLLKGLQNRGPQEIQGTLDLGNGLKGYVRGQISDVAREAALTRSS